MSTLTAITAFALTDDENIVLHIFADDGQAREFILADPEQLLVSIRRAVAAKEQERRRAALLIKSQPKDGVTVDGWQV